jgi:hypothetical protein
MDIQRIREILKACPTPEAIKQGTDQAKMIKELHLMLGKKLNWGDYCFCNRADYLRRAKNIVNASA